MQTLIENLVKLQAVELERTRLSKAERALPAEIAQAEAALAAAEHEAAKANDALNGKPEARTNLNGQRLVALRSILQWFEHPRVKANDLPLHASGWLASEVYERLHELYPDDFPDEGNPEPWSWGVDAAGALIPVWAGRGKWRAINVLLACWELGLPEPEGPRPSEARHPLDQWWRNQNKSGGVVQPPH